MHACKFYVHGIGWGLDGLAVLDGHYGIIGLCPRYRVCIEYVIEYVIEDV